MAFNPVKVPANIGTNSTNAGGNQGFANIVYNFQYFEGGTPAARASVPFAQAPCNCTMIGVSSALGVVGTTNTYITPRSVRGLVGSTVDLTSSSAVFVGSASLGPAWTATIAWQGQAVQTIAQLNTSAGGATNQSTQIIPAPLAAAANRQVGQGDVLAIFTSGGMSSVTGLSMTVFLRDDNGAY